MGEIFLKLLNLSLTASLLILAVIGFRFIFRRTPKWIHCLLWSVVAIRLVFPFSIESAFGVLSNTEPIRDYAVVEGETQDYIPSIDSDLQLVQNSVNPMLAETFAYEEADSVAPLQRVTFICGIVWICGMVLFMLYTGISLFRLHLQIREAVPYKDNILVCDAVKSPFILGTIRPRIYLSSGLKEKEIEYIAAHEYAHLRRRDHWWKPLGYLLLCVYWFNPLCWIAYILFCKDIELACDEKVIRDMDIQDKKEYSRTLLSCARPRELVLACPLAFGEVGVKERVKSVLNYKKPAFWLIFVSIAACVVLAAGFLTTSPKKVSDDSAASSETNNSDNSALYSETTDNKDSSDIDIGEILETICSSPIESSNPGDYIKEHQSEYDTLLNNDEETLRYCIAEFMKGNQTDLRGHIMALVCEELLQSKGAIPVDAGTASNGQEWFDTLIAHGSNLVKPYLSFDDYNTIFGKEQKNTEEFTMEKLLSLCNAGREALQEAFTVDTAGGELPYSNAICKEEGE